MFFLLNKLKINLKKIKKKHSFYFSDFEQELSPKKQILSNLN